MRKHIDSIPALIIVTLLAILGVSCTPRMRRASHLARADRYFDAGQYDQAEIEYINVLHIDPSNLRALTRLGLLYYDEGRFGKALPFLAKARELNPKNLDVHLKLGFIRLAGAKWKEAQAEANWVLKERPQDSEAPVLLAEASVTTQDIEVVQQRLQKLSSAADTAPLEVALATLYFRQHDLKAAEAALQRGQTLDPKSCAVYSALGTLHWAQNNLKQAEQDFQTAAELSPPRSPRRLHYAQFKLQTGDLAAGKKILEEIVQKTPDYLPAWVSLAEVAAKEKKDDDCATFVNKILGRDPLNYDALLLDGRMKLAKGQTAKATAEFEGMARVYPQSPVVHYHVALAYVAGNEPGKAIASLNRALALNPNYADAALLLAGAKIKTGDLGSAVGSLKQLVQQRPDMVAAQLLLADTYQAQGDFDNALALSRQSEKLFPRNPEIPFRMGSVFVRQNRLDEARQAFARVLELAPDDLRALGQLVDVDLKQKQYQQALQLVDKQREKNPKQVEPYLLLARIYLTQGDTNQTETALMKAIELRPDFHTPYLSLARLYSSSGQHQKALDSLQTVVAKDPKAVGALMLIGVIHQQQDHYDAARDMYERVLAIDPKFAPALNNLAYLYSEHLGQLDKAYEVAHRARELLPSDPSTADTLGWILYKKRQYPYALSLLQESADKLPDQPEVQFHLGMAHYMLGEEEPARLALQHALTLSKEFLGNEEARRCLSILAYDVQSAGTEVRTSLEKSLAERPDDPVVLTRLATVYQRAGAVDKAIQAYQTALKVNPENVRALNDLAQLYAARPQDMQQATDLAKTAYKLAPDDPGVSHTLGCLTYQAGDYQWAANLLRETARKRPTDPEVLYDLAWAAYSIGQMSEAEDAMRRALQSGAPFSHADEAKRFLDLVALAEDPSQALTAQSRIEQALKSDPRSVPALMVAAAISEQKSSAAEAEQTYEKVLSRYPDFAPAEKRLAILYAEDPANNQRAYDLAAKAREAFPADPEVAKTLGIIVYRQGNYARSENLLAEAARKRDGDAELIYYLGVARYRLHERAESKQALQRALTLNLPGNLAAEANRILVELK